MTRGWATLRLWSAQVVEMTSRLQNATEGEAILPPNTVLGNDPILIKTDGVRLEAIRYSDHTWPELTNY